MPACPLCNQEASEIEINRHLDRGCPTERDTKQKTAFSFITPSSSDENAKKDKKGKTESGHTELGTGAASTITNTTTSTTKRPAPHNANDLKESKDTDFEARKRAKLKDLPFAERVRPQTLDEYVGQAHLVGENGGILRNFLSRDNCPSMILWGPPGVGKTTFARILAKTTRSRFVELSATSNGINEVKQVVVEAKNHKALTGRKTILFLDEIHRYSRAQQDIFLPLVEKGEIVLIGATTENPSFKVNGALTSRCRVFTLEKLKKDDLKKIITRALSICNADRKDENLALVRLDDEVVSYIANLADGDGRIALNLVEITLAGIATGPGSETYSGDMIVDIESVRATLKRTHMLYDRVGDSHYDTISALHKSVRGSDPDAALFYLGKMLESGEDPLYIARRMVRMASEDIGLADDTLLPFAVATYTAVQQLGMPESDCILAHCAVKLAEAKKSVRVYRAYNAVKALMHDEKSGAASAVVPLHLRNAPTKLMKDLEYGKEYKYNPDYIDGKVKQQYMPEGLEGLKFLDAKDKHLGDMRDPDLW